MTEAEKAYRKQLIDSIINDLEELARKRKQKELYLWEIQ